MSDERKDDSIITFIDFDPLGRETFRTDVGPTCRVDTITCRDYESVTVMETPARSPLLAWILRR